MNKVIVNTTKFPAIPPDDYKGSVAEWQRLFHVRGYWDGKDPADLMDVYVDEKEYDEILAICEE